MRAAANTISLIAANDGGHTLLADTSVSHHHDPQWLRCPHELWPFYQGSRLCNKSVAGLQAFNRICYEILLRHHADAGHAFPPNSTSSQAGQLTRELSLTRHFGLPVSVARRPPPPFTEPRRAIESLP